MNLNREGHESCAEKYSNYQLKSVQCIFHLRQLVLINNINDAILSILFQWINYFPLQMISSSISCLLLQFSKLIQTKKTVIKIHVISKWCKYYLICIPLQDIDATLIQKSQL